MGIAFFDNQKIDHIGQEAVTLEYFLIIMFLLLTLDLLILILLAALALGFILPLPFTVLIWLVIPIGFIGCWRKNHILLLIYVVSGALAMFLLMLGMAILVLIIADVATACGLDSCKIGQKFLIPTILVYIMAGSSFLLGGIVLGIGIRTFTRYWKLRQKIVRELRGYKAAPKKNKEEDEKSDEEEDEEEEDYY
eukprot:TRINITY_DN21135_c0_g3_i1.p1 TRINITY_DN21135_c0_g3~~TRINITY_DN21135_c0_g3_i1.p1  ORF type:complete len:194 (+),score=41.01 TRINITY_DN21135_c0_g3_i1:103-684(+)